MSFLCSFQCIELLIDILECLSIDWNNVITSKRLDFSRPGSTSVSAGNTNDTILPMTDRTVAPYNLLLPLSDRPAEAAGLAHALISGLWTRLSRPVWLTVSGDHLYNRFSSSHMDANKLSEPGK
ncbi:unnamed protein product [Protopolystoma xenopodis]|uniref:Uncharacterized protein n=1 Tax=Protopolystoma xenopodis TaxID=117903 RepID=A0A448XR98_9PLAT|nr:unnamed protein product [Protopolystoma xenopodis]